MKDTLIFEGKNYISANRAAKTMSYAQDYIGQLCRSGKLDCRMVGRSWFVTEGSLLAHRANAIDSTAERVAKIVLAPTICPISISPLVIIPIPPIPPIPPTSSFKYESVKASLLPELQKKVPMQFIMPKLDETYRAQTLSISAFRDVRTLLAVAFLTGSSFLFTHTLSPRAYETLTANLISVFHDGFSTMTAVVAQPVVEQSPTYTYNGIAVAPSTYSQSDEAMKASIRNSFSDPVNVHPDESGTAGVITPVFRKKDGKDFVYVLVPVDNVKK